MARALVIGAGIGGLATGIRLARRGYDVDVFEANAYAGGKLTEIRSGDFRFDAGPSLFTMPQLMDELIQLSGVHSHFEYHKLDEICRYFYEDGTVIKGYGDVSRFAREVTEKTGVPGRKVIRHLKKSRFIYQTTSHLFLQRSLHKISSYLNLKTLDSMLKLPFLHIFTSMNRVNEKALGHEKVVQLFNRYATYNGSDPYRAPGILNIIPHLEFNQGAFFPSGGMHAITNCLVEMAEKLKVRVHYNSPVEKILLEGSKTAGVLVGGKEFKADTVICNMDIVPAYRKLLPDVKAPEKTLAQERSSSALIFYWGMGKSFPKLILHNIFFSAHYRKEFDHLFEKKGIYHDPTVYVNISSKEKADDAPEGKENWFVMINVPGNSGQDWDLLIKEARKNVLAKLSRSLGDDIESLIETEEVLDPRSIESKTMSHQGSLYGSSSNSRMAAFFRHPNFSVRIKGLYFCGGSVHPGGGIPLALSSAAIVDQLVREA